MTITDKIRKLIIDKNLTSTKFADDIDVPRPSISHILSGRNKPSLEIVQKIIKKYPELGLEWVIEEEDFNTPNNTQNAVNQSNIPPRRIGYLNRELNERKIPEQNNVQSNLGAISNGVNFNGMSISDGANKTIKKITVFFTDGTFIDINSTF
ncbi:MAG: helix-turn-helix transcriptional regulator [Spirosomataceae bacterium]